MNAFAEITLAVAKAVSETSTFVYILAWIGLVVGLVVFFVVIFLLQGVLTPLRKILGDVQEAKTAPMLEHGVRGTEELGRTQQLASSVPDLAVAYMNKLGLAVDTSPPRRR